MKTRKWGRLPFVVQDHAWDLGITQHPHYADYLNRRDKPTQSFDGERLDFSAMEKMCKKSQVNYLRFNILNLNNSVYSRSGVWLIIIFFYIISISGILFSGYRTNFAQNHRKETSGSNQFLFIWTQSDGAGSFLQTGKDTCIRENICHREILFDLRKILGEISFFLGGGFILNVHFKLIYNFKNCSWWS